MSTILIYFIAGLFLALLFLNLFFRVRVIKVYKRLVQQRVEFNSMDVFKADKQMEKVYRQFPAAKNDIQAFIYYIRLSVFMAVSIVVLITLLGLVLHYQQ